MTGRVLAAGIVVSLALVRAVSLVLVGSVLLVRVAAAAEPAPMSEPPRSMAEILALPADNVQDALDSDLRSVADRKRDEGEKIEAVLRESGIARGMRVVDLRAGDGYFTQVLALAVRRYGKTWGNNDPASVDPATADAWKKRLHGPAAGDISELAAPLGGPLPPFVQRIDIVFSRGASHEAVRRSVDPGAMHGAVLAALAPGGKYVIVDARAADSADPGLAASLCRASEKSVIREAEAAGFRFLAASSALAAPDDVRERTACGSAAPDRFLLIFEKPKS